MTMREPIALDQYETLFLAAFYMATEGDTARAVDPEQVTQQLRHWTRGTGTPYANQLKTKGLLESTDNQTFRLTEVGRQMGWANAHKVDADDNLALLTGIYRKAHGRLAAMVDATAVGAALGLRGTRAGKLIQWLSDNKLVAIQTPRGYEPILVKMRLAGRDRVREEDNVAYWLWNNQTLGALSGAFLGALLGLLPHDPSRRQATLISCAAGVVIGSGLTFVLQRVPLRLRWRLIGWIAFGAIAVASWSWLVKG